MACCCAAPPVESESVVVTPILVKEEPKAAPPPKVEAPPPAPPPAPAKVPDPVPAPAPEPVKQEPVKEFTVNLSKGGGQSLGMNLVMNEDKTFFFIEAVKAGIVLEYNKNADSDKKIEVGDILSSVNKVTSNGMINELSQNSNVELLIKKSKEVTLTIAKNGPLGLDLMYQDPKEYVIVKSILDGAVKDHNAKVGADKQLKVPSRILAVNGVRGKGSELFSKVQNGSGSLDLTLSQLL